MEYRCDQPQPPADPEVPSAFRCVRRELRSAHSLLPFLNHPCFLNHLCVQSNVEYEYFRDQFVLSTKSAYKAGEQVGAALFCWACAQANHHG